MIKLAGCKLILYVVCNNFCRFINHLRLATFTIKIMETAYISVTSTIPKKEVATNVVRGLFFKFLY